MAETKSINGKNANIKLFKSDNLFKAIAKLAIPTIISQIILVLYNMADTFFIGLTENDARITAVTICMPAYMILTAISNLFGIGGAAVISRALGKNKLDKARNASSFSFYACATTSIVYSLIIFIFINPIINALGGSDPTVHEYAKQYILYSIVIGGAMTAMNNFLGHLLRSEGHSFLAGFGVALGGVLNIGLDPLFMFVILEEGQEVLAAGLATAVSNVIALLFFIFVLVGKRKNTVLSFKFYKEMFNKKLVRGILLTGLPACLMTLFENISYAVLEVIISNYGVAVQSGLGVAKKINMLAHSIVRGMSQGVLPLIAYNYATKNIKRMNRALLLSCGFSILIAAICTTVNLIFSQQLSSIFIITERDSLEHASTFLKILTIGAPFSAFAYAVISFFQATKRSKQSLLLALLRKGILDIPLMFIFATSSMYMVVWATPVADALCCVIAIILYVIFTRTMERKYGKKKDVLDEAVNNKL